MPEIDYNYQLENKDKAIENLARLRMDVIKSCFEFIGEDLGKTNNDIEYHNYMVDNPLQLLGGNGFGSPGYLGGGNIPFNSIDEFLSKLDITAFQKYQANFRGTMYCGNIMRTTIARKINFNSIPKHFIDTCKNISRETGVPLGFYILVSQSEGGFKDAGSIRVVDKYGKEHLYGGYFGQDKYSGYGEGQPLEVQARGAVTDNYKKIVNTSPGASLVERLFLGYISQHLPVVGWYYWKHTGGKIWSVDPDWIANNIKSLYPEIGKVTLAEAIAVNIAGQYMALQLASRPDLIS